MTAKPVTNVVASIRRRLLNLSQARSTDYNEMLAQYAIERFLYRLSKSEVAHKFVLKGAMLFRAWAGNLHRPTKDLDLLGFGEATAAAVAAAVRSVLATPVADDGLVFDPDSIQAGEIREGQEYGGIRAKVLAKLGTARIPVQIDVGFGDAITPGASQGVFPTLLDQDAPVLRMYPPETVIAEKLEAIVTLGIANSRMKDFYDLLAMFRFPNLQDEALAQAIAATFRRRGTPLPEQIPVGLSEAYGLDSMARRRWSEFLVRLRITDAPVDLAAVIDSVRSRLWPVIEKARGLA